MNNAVVLDLQEYKAQQLIEDGKFRVSNGDIDLAIEAFEKSVNTRPTADAYTYMGWLINLKGETNKAIELCKKAIHLDSEFGNPYNDIGSYLIQTSRLDEAVPWLERAKLATRYEPKHFPYMNLGRIYSAKGQYLKALIEFRGALKFAPDNLEILNVIHQLESLV